jgi:hypothetical protein
MVAVSPGGAAGLIASRSRWLLAQRWAMELTLVLLEAKMEIDAWHWVTPA